MLAEFVYVRRPSGFPSKAISFRLALTFCTQYTIAPGACQEDSMLISQFWRFAENIVLAQKPSCAAGRAMIK